MSLGVLNNLSAMYAENNLNNTNNSLNTVLQQLSSGSKINSGADDAAGLSLVDGLQANSMALSQSQTNSSEGVGLLTVADGALSQVTNLLNRAVTLATEASNGTLNSSQDTAANQEYQSILSEISNIGSTTTYNNQAVFNSNTNIYTGDSSTLGSSIDSLDIRTLSSSNVGDSGGVMSYSNGQNSVFVNLSSSTVNAQATDALNSSGTTTINVNYLVKGADGNETQASSSITAGGSSGYTNTANGLIDAINASGLGLSANFATQSQAGVAGGGTQTGVQITGGLVSVGVDPSSVSTSGTLSLAGDSASSLLAQGQTVSIQTGAQTAISVAITPTIKTLGDLAGAINTASAANSSNGQTQVVATVVTDSQGNQTLSLADQTQGEGALAVTTTSSSYVPTLNATVAGGNPVQVQFATGTPGAATVPGTPGSEATASLGISGIGTNAAAAPLSGSLTLSNGSSGTITINMNSSAASNATTINLSTANSNLTGLAAALNGTSGDANAAAAVAALGLSASVTSTGLSLTSNTVNTTIGGSSAGLTAKPSLGLSDTVNGAAAGNATAAVTTISMVGGNGYNGGDTLTAGSSIVVTNGTTDAPGTPVTFTMGGNTGNDTATQFYTGAGTTLTSLLGVMSGAGAAAAGIASASVIGNQIVLTSSVPGTTLNATSALEDKVAVSAGSVIAAVPINVGSASTGATFATANVGLDANSDPITPTGSDALTGSLVLSNGASGNITINMNSNAANTSNTINLSTANSNLSGLMSAINGNSAAATALGITAAMNATDTGLNFSTSELGTKINVTSTGMSTVSQMEFTNPTTAAPGVYASGTLALSDSAKITGAGATFAGQVTITSGGVADTFIMGTGSNSFSATANTIYTGASTLASLTTSIANESAQGTSLAYAANNANGVLGVTAVADVATGGIDIQSQTTNLAMTVTGSTLAMTAANTGASGTQGAAVVPTALAAHVTLGNSGTNNQGGDTITGTVTLANSGGISTVFTMGGSGQGAASGLGTAAVTVNGTTMNDLMNAINADSTGDYAGAAGANFSAQMDAQGGTGLVVTAADTTSTITTPTVNLSDNYGGSVNATAGQVATGATYASSVLGADQQIGSGDALSGAIVLNNGGSNYTFSMAASSAGSTSNAINTDGHSLQNLATAISQSGIGITANIVNGALQLQSNNSATTIAVVGTPTLADSQGETFAGGTGTAATPGTPGSASTATLTLQSGSDANDTDTLTGGVILNGTGGPVTFTMGQNGVTNLNTLAQAISNNATLGINAAATSTGLNLSMKTDNTTPITGSSTLQDTLGNAAATATLGSFRSESDTLSNGQINYTINGAAHSIATTAGETVSGLVSAINTTLAATDGISAAWDSVNNNVVLTSNLYGATGNFSATSSDVSDTTAGKSLDYAHAAAYGVGITNSAGTTSLYDSSTQGAPGGPSAAYANFVANTSGSSGIATISYSDGAGQSLAATDLSSQTDAQATLTALNSAITDVAAQDGYIGAQINTLNAVSSVLSTQQENVVSAQNAVQATDYATATSNMSKYEILSQTGIAALAQANSIQQEVTKLLQ